MISSSPIGAMHDSGGAMILVVSIAALILATSLVSRRRGLLSGLMPAFSQISFATPGPTREKSSCKNELTVRFSLSLTIFSSTPSSTPCGCGLISSTSGGSSLVPRWYSVTLLSGSV